MGNRHAPGRGQPSAVEIDERLHADRLDSARSKRTWTAQLDELPDGVFITREGANEHALLIQGRSLLAWSPGGYRKRMLRKTGELVSVLTPESSVAAIRAGFAPEVHPSVREV